MCSFTPVAYARGSPVALSVSRGTLTATFLLRLVLASCVFHVKHVRLVGCFTWNGSLGVGWSIGFLGTAGLEDRAMGIISNLTSSI